MVGQNLSGMESQRTDHLADDLFAGHHGVEQHRLRFGPVVAKEGEPSVEEASGLNPQVPGRDRMRFGEGGGIDADFTAADLDGLARKADDAFDDPFVAEPGDDDLPAHRIAFVEGTPVDEEDVAGVERGLHAGADHHHPIEPGAEDGEEGEEGDEQEEPTAGGAACGVGSGDVRVAAGGRRGVDKVGPAHDSLPWRGLGSGTLPSVVRSSPGAGDGQNAWGISPR